MFGLTTKGLLVLWEFVFEVILVEVVLVEFNSVNDVEVTFVVPVVVVVVDFWGKILFLSMGGGFTIADRIKIGPDNNRNSDTNFNDLRIERALIKFEKWRKTSIKIIIKTIYGATKIKSRNRVYGNPVNRKVKMEKKELNGFEKV